MNRKRLIGLTVRIVTVVILLIWLSKGDQLIELWQSVTKISTLSIIAGLGLALLNMYLASLRWRSLLIAFGARKRPPTSRLLKLFLVGQFYNTFVPGAVGGDVIRAYFLRTCFAEAAGTYVVVIAERLVGLGALGVIFAVGYLNQPELIPINNTMPWAFGLLTLCLCLVASRPIARRLSQWWQALPRVNAPQQLLAAFGISVLGHCSTILIFVTFAATFVPSLNWMTLIVVVPLSLIASVIPIAILGIGPREAAMVGMLSLLGIPKADALALSLSFAAIVIFVAALGGLIHLIEGEDVGLTTRSDASGTTQSSDVNPLQG